MRVAVIGMGKTGLPIAVALHKQGYAVVGVDVVPERLAQLADPTFDPAEPQCSWKERKGIELTPFVASAIRRTDLALMIVQTPEIGLKTGVIDLAPTEIASAQIGEALASAPKPYTVVMSSTVMPGTCKCVIAPRVGPTCSVVFNPVWIALGSVVANYLSPPVVVLGTDGPVPDSVKELSKQVFGEARPILTDTVTAEMTKLVYNVWCTLKMAFVNEAALAYQAAGADASVVEGFFRGGGERPGAFLRPGPPPGGPCFPRDLRFAYLLEAGRSSFRKLVSTIDILNEGALTRLVQEVKALAEPRATVGIVGLTYKPGVPVLEESTSLVLATLLAAEGFGVVGYDPLIREGVSELELTSSLDACIQMSDVLVEMHAGVVPDDVMISVVRPWRM